MAESERGPSSSTADDVTITETVVEERGPSEREGPLVLKLRSPETKKKAVNWTSGTVNNEGMNKKKSKCCCIYKKPRMFGESSDESDDEHDCTNNSHGHKKKCPRHNDAEKESNAASSNGTEHTGGEEASH